MERLKRYLILFLIIVFVSTVGVVTGLFILRHEEKKVLVGLEESLEIASKAAGAAKDRLDEEKRKAELLAEELVKEKEKKELILAQLEEKDTIINDLLFELEGDKKEILGLKKGLEELQERLKLVMASREALKKKATRALSKPTRGEVSLEKIVVKAAPSLQGRVMVVNREFDFVILDLGKEDNLKVGAILSIYRQDKLIARVQVERVDEQLSAAAILPQWKNAEIKENDIVREL